MVESKTLGNWSYNDMIYLFFKAILYFEGRAIQYILFLIKYISVLNTIFCIKSTHLHVFSVYNCHNWTFFVVDSFNAY